MKKFVLILAFSIAIFAILLADDTTEVYIGNPEATTSHAQRVLNFNARNALSQTLYFESEMIIEGELKTGLITEIRWLHRYNSAISLDIYPVSIYMAHTTLNSFQSTTAWLPYDQFTKVYEGTLDIQITGPVGTPFQEVPVILNTPFEYTGGNFVIMAYKLKPEGSPQTANQWQVSQTIATSRNLWQSSATVWPYISEAYPTAGTLAPNGDFPNTMVVFYDGAVGHLGGTVTTEGMPIEGAKIQVDNTSRFAFSNAEGIYSFPSLPVGTISITASRYLYLDVNIEDIVITENQTTTQDIEMTGTQYDLTAISITGFLYPVVGEPIIHTIRIKNESIQTQDGGYTVELRQVGLDEPLAIAPGVVIESEEIIDFDIEWIPNTAGFAEIYGHIVFEEDENPNNNTTELLNIDVQIEGAVISYIGDPESTSFVRENPMDHFYRFSLSQTIYLESDIEAYGLISQMHYRFRGFGDIIGGSPVRIYLATTELEHFNAGTANPALWVPYDQFTLVFNGIIPTDYQGEKDLQIIFDTPYPYSGGNLVIMVEKSDPQNYGLNNFYHSTASTGLNKTISHYSSSTPYNLETTYPTPTRRARFPNIRLVTLTQGHGSLSGTVTHEGDPIDEVRITLNEIGMSIMTNAAGQYSFPYLMPGTYSITASKHAHQTQTIGNIIITSGEATTQNIAMISIPWDLAALSVVGPRIPIAQEESFYSVRIRNEGYNTVTPDQYSVVIKRVGNNNILGTVAGLDIDPGQEITFQVPWTPTTAEYLEVYGEVVFSQDLDPANNVTDNYSVYVQPVGMNVTYVGDPTSGSSSAMHPVNYLWRNSLSQTIYLDSELSYHGAVMGMMIRYTGTDEIPNHPVSIYMTRTDEINFEEQDAWIEFEQFDLVYHGTPSLASGPGDFFLPFDTPFVHTGGNIAVMIYKHHMQQIVSRSFQITPTSATTGGRRVIYAYHDNIILDPENGINADWPTGWVAFAYGNASFLTTQEGQGHISGTVSSQGAPVSGVEISLNGTSRKVFSDDDGNFNIPFIFEGTVSITAKKHGFYDFTVNNISIVAGHTTTVNVPLPAIPTFIVSGTVISSNTGVGVPEAEIRLTGYENYITTTNTQGNFTIQGVYELNTYTIDVHKSGYVRHIDEEIIVASANLVIPNIVLLERAYPVNNPHAESTPSAVTVSWEAPTGGLDTWLYHTHSEESIGGWTSMYTPYSVTTAIRFTAEMLDEKGVAGAELTQVAYYLHTLEEPGIHTIYIYKGGYIIGTGSGAVVDLGTLVYEQLVDVSTVAPGQWNYVDLDYIVDIPVGEEFWIAVNVSHSTGYVLGRDQGPAVAPGFSDIIDFGSGWQLFGWAVSGNNMIRGLAENAHGPIILDPISERDRNNNISIPENRNSRSMRNSSSERRSIQALSESKAVSRALTEYRIYRANIDTLNDENTWTFVNSTTELEYVDNEWGQLPHGAFRYVIQAVYSEDNISRSVFTNMVHRGMMGTVDLYITTNDDISLENVTVSLRNNSGNPLHNYQQTANINLIHFPAVWRGTYTVTVTSPGYRPYVNNNVPIAPDAVSLDITLIRPLVPQFVLAEQVAEGVSVNWGEPDPGMDLWFSHTNASAAVNGIGTNNAARFIIAHRFDTAQLQTMGVAGATLTKVAYAPRQIANFHEIQIYIGGSANPLNSGDLVYSQEIDNDMMLINQFTDYELEEQIYIPFDQELWIAIMVDASMGYPLGIDAGPHLLGYGNVIQYNNVWTTLNQLSDVSANWTIRGFAEGASGPVTFGSNIELPYAKQNEVEIKATAGLESINRQVNLLSSEEFFRALTEINPLYQPIMRVAEGYKIYRADLDSINDQDLWELLEENHSSSTYLDDSWWEADLGQYQFIVRSILANQNISLPAFSNVINRVPFDLQAPTGLEYELENYFDVVLSWEAPNNILRGYRVYRDNVPFPDLVLETTFTERGLEVGEYEYSIKAVYWAGDSEPVSVIVNITGSDSDPSIPMETVLRGNFPNPFNPVTTISFDIREEGHVRIDIFNIRGQRVRTLINEEMTSGKYSLEWNGNDDNGRNVSSGVYFYRMTAVDFNETKRMVLMK
ncbi:MAG: carboxypeptidase regulatory-like domain-containing protein [Candidatus Cloacimonetes bacterium]|nr:carboxypeptidase regulatory-like domain-containing protein [Candidatus Cloacimonadota bacterium]